MLDYLKSIPCTRGNISVSCFVQIWVWSVEVPNQHVSDFSLTAVKLPFYIRETLHPLIITISTTVQSHRGTMLFCISHVN